jgi:hypothetical protein
MLVARLKGSDALKLSVLVDDQIDMCDWRLEVPQQALGRRQQSSEA